MEVPTIFLLVSKSEIKKLKTQKWSDFGSLWSLEVGKKNYNLSNFYIWFLVLSKKKKEGWLQPWLSIWNMKDSTRLTTFWPSLNMLITLCCHPTPITLIHWTIIMQETHVFKSMDNPKCKFFQHVDLFSHFFTQSLALTIFPLAQNKFTNVSLWYRFHSFSCNWKKCE